VEPSQDQRFGTNRSRVEQVQGKRLMYFAPDR
jgi:hypothetical protein